MTAWSGRLHEAEVRRPLLRRVLGARLVRRSAGRIGARMAASALQALTLLLLARALPVSQFGLFAVGIAIGYLAAAAATWGAPYRVLRAAAEDRPGNLRATLLVAELSGIGILLAAAGVLRITQALPLAVFAGCMSGLADHLGTFGQFDAAGNDRHTSASVMAVQQRAVLAVGLLLAPAPLVWPIFFTATAVGVVHPIAHAILTGRGGRPALRSMRGSLGYWTYGLTLTSPQLEAPVVNAVADASVAGLYGIANRVANPLTILSSALSSIFIPEMARCASAQERDRLGRRFVLLSAAYAGLVAVCAPWIAPLVVLLTGPRYQQAEPLIMATTIAAGVSAVSQAYNAVLIAAGRPLASTMTLAIGTGVSLAMLSWTASFDGARALWIAPLVTQVSVLLLFVLVSRRHRAT